MRSILYRRVPGQRVREYLCVQAAWRCGAAGETELSRPCRTRAGVAGMSGVCAPRFSLIRAPDRVIVHNVEPQSRGEAASIWRRLLGVKLT